VIIAKAIAKERDRRELEREYEEKRRQRAEFERKQIEKGLVKFVNVLGEERWGTPEQVRQWKIVDMDMKDNFAKLTWRQFEKVVADLFTKMGYAVELQGPPDFGADILARKGPDTVVVQVKRWKEGQNVGNRDIQRLLGSMPYYNANKAIFVTSSDFTNAARKQAFRAPIELWNYRKTCEMIEEYLLDIKESLKGGT